MPSPAASTAPFPNRHSPRRKNGFSPPYSKAQMVTWFAWPLLVLQFFFFASPNLPLAASLPVSLIFGVVAVAVVIFAYQTIQADPMDTYLAKHLQKQQQQQQDSINGNNGDNGNNDHHHHHHGASFDNTTTGPPEPMKQCWICDTQVAEHSMHCKFCNKCVGHFDHHCMWLNTCIGDVNYSSFFQTMIWITAMLTIHFAVQAALFITVLVERSNHEEGVIRRRAEGWFHPNRSATDNTDGTVVALIVIWILFCVVDSMGLALILQLLSFHLRLQKKKLSTYLFIVQENQRKREVLRKAGLRRAKRIETMAQARQDGKTFYAMRLRIGGNAMIGAYCPCCDPLPPDEEEEEVEFGSMPKKSQLSATAAATALPPSNGVTFMSVKKAVPEEQMETDTTTQDDQEAPPRTA